MPDRLAGLPRHPHEGGVFLRGGARHQAEDQGKPGNATRYAYKRHKTVLLSEEDYAI
ncbi:hypothetical protein K32_28160 [Kaistia sp. 32K]|nr:hypothetical protein K32_28160 [Kaistia sp. 32K]